MDIRNLSHRSFFELPPLSELEFGEIVSVNLSSQTSPYTHGLHRYPAKFIPQIPRWAIREFSSPGDVVLDPFMGSGTSIVEAIAAGRVGQGIDIDPLSCLIARAKTSKLDTQRLRTFQAQLAVSIARDGGELSVPMSGVKNFEHWFNAEAWRTLQSIRRNILALDCTPEERTFFLCVFSSILRAVSNADDQTQKTYVSGTLKKVPPLVRPTFTRNLEKAIRSADSLNSKRGSTKSELYEASATSLPIDDNSVDLVVTSPPYVDSVDYMYNMMLEYFWLGDILGVSSRQEFNAARKRALGSKQPEAELPLPSELVELIDGATLPDYRRAAAISYFAAMKQHFAEAARVLKNDGYYILVVGNSQTESGQLPVHDALIELSASQGLHLVDAFGYRIRRHYMKFPRKGRGGIILMDWVIALQKRPFAGRIRSRLPLPAFRLSPDQVAN